MKTETPAANIEQLVDGSLGAGERHATLRWIDRDAPEYWRNLALGFVEAQILREAAVEEAKTLNLPPLKKSNYWPRFLKGGLAACFAGGMFFSGYALNGQNHHPAHNVQAKQQRPAPQVPQAPVAGPHSPTSLASAAGENPDIVVPVAFNQDIRSAPALERSASAVRRLNDAIAPSGYEAALMTRYLSKKLENGERIVIPINKVILKHRGQ